MELKFITIKPRATVMQCLQTTFRDVLENEKQTYEVRKMCSLMLQAYQI